jgi:hypothetical protein
MAAGHIAVHFWAAADALAPTSGLRAVLDLVEHLLSPIVG